MITRPSGAAVRGIGLVGLVVVAAVALDSTPRRLPPATTSLRGSTGGAPTVVVLTLSSLAGLVIILWAWRRLRRTYRRRQRPEPELTPTWSPTRRSQLAGLFLGLALLTGPWLLLLASTHLERSLPSARSQPVPSGEAPARWAAIPISPGGKVLTPEGRVLALVAGLALVLLTLVWAHWAGRHRQKAGGSVDPLPRTPDHTTPTPPHIQAAVRASWPVSNSNRVRVIAAFTTLQATIDPRGASVATETPDEFLDRLCVSDARLAHDSIVLTNLFQRARFSELALDREDARSAESALHGVLSSLEGRS